MQTLSFSAGLTAAAVDLAWSVWAELGVSGWTRRHQHWGIDPEPLIVFTAGFGDADPRLRDEATDWCVRFARYISAARLKNVLAAFAEGRDEVRAEFGEFAATVNAHITSGSPWSGATAPRRYTPTRRSRLENFAPPALIALRLRALFGVGARAEVLRILLERPQAALAAGDFDTVFYTKRNVADALEALRMAGLLEELQVRNEHRYRLLRPANVRSFVGLTPKLSPDWNAVFTLLFDLSALARRGSAWSPIIGAVEARKLLRERRATLQRVGLQGPPGVTGDAYWAAFEAWATDVARRLAAGEYPARGQA